MFWNKSNGFSQFDTLALCSYNFTPKWGQNWYECFIQLLSRRHNCPIDTDTIIIIRHNLHRLHLANVSVPPLKLLRYFLGFSVFRKFLHPRKNGTSNVLSNNTQLSFFIECIAGTFDENCVKECGKCKTSPCNSVTGACDNTGCQTGYMGTGCFNSKYSPKVSKL